jgi:hypothetical protein
MAHLNGAISNAGVPLRKAFDLAVPGTGTVEFTFIDWTFRTANPNLLPTNSPLSRLQQRVTLASRNRNVPLNPDPSAVDDHLFRVGFTERIHRTRGLATHASIKSARKWKFSSPTTLTRATSATWKTSAWNC